MNQANINTPAGRQIRPPYRVPYYSQFASPELVYDIVNGAASARDDPRWKEFGADSPEEYEHWAWKACGIASLKMAAEALGAARRTMMEWIRDGLARGGFIHAQEAGGGRPSGWLHGALAALAAEHGLQAGCASAVNPERIAVLLDEGRLVIASVSYELGTRERITRDRGHLILLHGYSRLGTRIEALLANNPSGRHPELRRDCWIPAARFAAGFSGRVVTVGPPGANRR